MRVWHLLDAIITQDASLQAGIAGVKSEEKDVINYFEKAATCLEKFNPVAKRKGSSDNDSNPKYSAASANISSSSASDKVSKEKSGEELQYYKKSKFRKLSNS